MLKCWQAKPRAGEAMEQRMTAPHSAPASCAPTMTFGPWQRRREKTFVPPQRDSSKACRITLIEGMRAYLAFWVLACHVLWLSGYTENSLTGVPKMLGLGYYAVDVFIIISGFVVFFLLDKKNENYRQFIVRRFFRLFPLFIVLFFVSIPLSRVTGSNLTQAGHFWAPDQVELLGRLLESWWRNIQWHIAVHVTMLHGAVPQVVLPDSPSAFLVPAWSVSLEWQ